MKPFLSLVIGLSASLAFADKQEISLHFHYREKHLEVPVRAPSFDDAIETAADKCLKFYTSEFDLSFSEKEDLVDICANPRKK